MSLICSICLLKSYVLKHSSVFSNWPSFFMCSTSVVSSIVLYACSMSSMCWAYFEICLFVIMAWMCSIYWVSNVCLICPMYLSGHSLYFSWYTPLCLSIYLSIYLSTYLPTYLPTHPPTYLPICLSLFLLFPLEAQGIHVKLLSLQFLNLRQLVGLPDGGVS
jgi:hypothetical protein